MKVRIHFSNFRFRDKKVRRNSKIAENSIYSLKIRKITDWCSSRASHWWTEIRCRGQLVLPHRPLRLHQPTVLDRVPVALPTQCETLEFHSFIRPIAVLISDIDIGFETRHMRRSFSLRLTLESMMNQMMTRLTEAAKNNEPSPKETAWSITLGRTALFQIKSKNAILSLSRKIWKITLSLSQTDRILHLSSWTRIRNSGRERNPPIPAKTWGKRISAHSRSSDQKRGTSWSELWFSCPSRDQGSVIMQNNTT